MYTLDLASRKEMRLTTNGTSTLRNGGVDWVYPEELNLGTAFWWSVGLATLSIIPCVILMRAESSARRAAKEHASKDPDEAVIESGAVAEALA